MGLIDVNKTEKLDVPHEPGEHITIRMLLATELDDAREVRMKRLMDLWGDSLASFSGVGGPQSVDSQVWVWVLNQMNDVFAQVELPVETEQAVSKALTELRREVTEEEGEETLAQRLAQYDGLTLLKYAVTGWSYGAPVNLEHLERLDGITRDWLVEEVVRRNTRPLASERRSGGSWSSGDVPANFNGSLASRELESS